MECDRSVVKAEERHKESANGKYMYTSKIYTCIRYECERGSGSAYMRQKARKCKRERKCKSWRY